LCDCVPCWLLHLWLHLPAVLVQLRQLHHLGHNVHGLLDHRQPVPVRQCVLSRLPHWSLRRLCLGVRIVQQLLCRLCRLSSQLHGLPDWPVPLRRRVLHGLPHWHLCQFEQHVCHLQHQLRCVLGLGNILHGLRVNWSDSSLRQRLLFDLPQRHVGVLLRSLRDLHRPLCQLHGWHIDILHRLCRQPATALRIDLLHGLPRWLVGKLVVVVCRLHKQLRDLRDVVLNVLVVCHRIQSQWLILCPCLPSWPVLECGHLHGLLVVLHELLRLGHNVHRLQRDIVPLQLRLLRNLPRSDLPEWFRLPTVHGTLCQLRQLECLHELHGRLQPLSRLVSCQLSLQHLRLWLVVRQLLQLVCRLRRFCLDVHRLPRRQLPVQLDVRLDLPQRLLRLGIHLCPVLVLLRNLHRDVLLVHQLPGEPVPLLRPVLLVLSCW